MHLASDFVGLLPLLALLCMQVLLAVKTRSRVGPFALRSSQKQLPKKSFRLTLQWVVDIALYGAGKHADSGCGGGLQ